MKRLAGRNKRTTALEQAAVRCRSGVQARRSSASSAKSSALFYMERLNQYANALCIASYDPRLKEH
jgi:hypothetical protein